MSSSGAYPGAATNDATVGTQNWRRSSDSGTSDAAMLDAIGGYNGYGGPFATGHNYPSAVTTKYLRASSFGFAIPGGATIDGVLAEAGIWSSAGGASYDNSIKLCVGGTISGNNKANGTAWPASYVSKQWGGAADLWGLSLTDSDVNNSGFGFGVACGVGGFDQVYMDYMYLYVFYTAAAPAAGGVTGHIGIAL